MEMSKEMSHRIYKECKKDGTDKICVWSDKMNETFYKPLMPELRNTINDSIANNVSELNTCKSNAFVRAQLVACKALKNVINALPDGYPIPFERKTK